MRLLIQGGRLITLDAEHRILDADVAIAGDRIAGVGPAEDLIRQHGQPEAVLDASGRYVIPGIVNAHTHVYQAAYRGLGDGLAIREWQERVTQPAYPYQSAEDAYWFTLAGCIENIRTGATTVINFQSYPNDFEACQLTARAFGETGLRGLLGKSFYASTARAELLTQRDRIVDDLEHVFAELHGAYEGRVRFCVGPPNAASAPTDLLQEVHAIAARHDSGIHTHVGGRRAEWMAAVGMRDLEYLASIGLIDAHFQAAHCVDVTPEECRAIGEHGGNAIHCPVSNMYLGMSVSDVPGLQAAGANVALGSDGPASNNNQDMFAVMKTASILHKSMRRDPSLYPPGQILEMAARNGARAAGVDAGVIEPGRLADLTVVDLSGAHNQPLHRPVSALVYTAHADDVESVVVGGQVVMRNRQIQTVDEQEILAEASRRMQRVLERSGLAQSLKPEWPWC
jgi:5-methylthioadenosine/S-adenosylhomocysteine deaminase